MKKTLVFIAVIIAAAICTCACINAVDSSTDVVEPNKTAAINSEHLPVIIYDNHYPLSYNEYQALCIAVMSEAGGESREGQMAVAQCVLNACIIDNERPLKILDKYQYANWSNNYTQQVEDAVQAVFTDGKTAVDAPIMFFYAPERTNSDWHESMSYVCTIGNHRFFAAPTEIS